MQMDRQMDRQVDRQVDRWLDEWTNKQLDGKTPIVETDGKKDK